MAGPRNALMSLLVLAGGLALLFAAFCALLYWKQDALIFFPRPNDARFRDAWVDQRVEVRTPTGMLEGWWVVNPQATHSTTLLYFGGNAEDVLYTAATSTNLDARRMLVVNYRGYGGTAGRPSEQALYEDALAIYDYATREADVRPEDIVVMGRSLGTGVATLLARERPVRAVILITPFDSLVAVAATHYSFLPVNTLLRHRFMSVERAPHLQMPVLILAAEWDRVVPPVHAQRLHEAWAGEKEIRVLDRVGHNDIEQHPDYYPAINRFLQAQR